jgi:Helix-turn-helix domain
MRHQEGGLSWFGKQYLECCEAPPHVKFLLLTLCEYADRDGWCNPSLRRLAAGMGVTERTVQRSRAVAIELGLLAYKPGRWKSNGGEYVLLRPKGDAGVALTDVQRVTLQRSKGWRYRGSKGDAHVHRTSKKFQEDGEAAPLLGPPSPGLVRCFTCYAVAPVAGELNGQPICQKCADLSRKEEAA